jgi:hypothetical protein
MTGTETVVTGAEAPASGATWARWGVADDEDYAQIATDDSADDATAATDGGPTTLRPDGLVLELDESDASEERAAPHNNRQRAAMSGRRGLDAAIERATDLASRLGGLQPVKRTYEIGQRVRHTDYGEGIISGISGTGLRAVGSVIFDGPAGTRKFILGHGALEPAG